MFDPDDAIKGIKEQRAFPLLPNEVALCERCFKNPVMTYPPTAAELDQGIEIHRERYCGACMRSVV